MHIHVSLILIYIEFVIKRADFKHTGALFSLLWIERYMITGRAKYFSLLSHIMSIAV